MGQRGQHSHGTTGHSGRVCVFPRHTHTCTGSHQGEGPGLVKQGWALHEAQKRPMQFANRGCVN